MTRIQTKSAPQFEWRFLGPKFWPTWLLVSMLYSISWLPYRLQMALGRGLGNLLHRVMTKRRKIAERNLQLCFPTMSQSERAALLKVNFQNTGIAMFESGMAWWWPNWRVQNKVHYKGTEYIEQAKQQNQGVLLLMVHVLPLEMMARTLNSYTEYAGFYRPHNNPLLEWLQFRGRQQGRNVLIGKRDVKGMIQALNKGYVSAYLPDHDYGPKRAVFAPLFEVKQAACTTGTELFAKTKNTVTIPTFMKRLPGNEGYELEFLPPIREYPTDDPVENATIINQWVEQAIRHNLEQYMWVHRRFKTRPENEPESLY